MLVEQLPGSFQAALAVVWTNLLSYIPKLVFGILLFAIGWLIAIILGRVVSQLVNALKVDKAFEAAGLDDFFKHAGFKLNAASLFGGFFKWATIIVFFTLTLEILQLDQVSYFMWNQVLPFLPKVVIAALIVIIGAVVADKLKDAILGAARATGIKSAKLVAGLAKWAVWVLAILAALTQIDVATFIIQTFMTGFVFAASLAFGLSFGLGGKEEAARYLAKLRKELSDD